METWVRNMGQAGGREDGPLALICSDNQSPLSSFEYTILTECDDLQCDYATVSLVLELPFSFVLKQSLLNDEERGPCRACSQSGTHAFNPSCELFLRHALTTRPLNGMFCGVGLPLRPPETIPLPPQSGPKFKPARYYSTSRVTPYYILTVSHCPKYHLFHLSSPAQIPPYPLILVHSQPSQPFVWLSLHDQHAVVVVFF